MSPVVSSESEIESEAESKAESEVTEDGYITFAEPPLSPNQNCPDLLCQALTRGLLIRWHPRGCARVVALPCICLIDRRHS